MRIIPRGDGCFMLVSKLRPVTVGHMSLLYIDPAPNISVSLIFCFLDICSPETGGNP
jgi:hypothetical protein